MAFILKQKPPAECQTTMVFLHPIPLQPGVLEAANNLPLSLQWYPSSVLDWYRLIWLLHL